MVKVLKGRPDEPFPPGRKPAVAKAMDRYATQASLQALKEKEMLGEQLGVDPDQYSLEELRAMAGSEGGEFEDELKGDETGSELPPETEKPSTSSGDEEKPKPAAGGKPKDEGEGEQPKEDEEEAGGSSSSSSGEATGGGESERDREDDGGGGNGGHRDEERSVI